MDPPCGLFLDEVANIGPLPQLPALMSFAGGTGIFLVAVLQSMAQARNRWGRDAAEMLWVPPPSRSSSAAWRGRTCADSELAREYRELLTTSQRGRTDYSVQTTLQDRKTMTPGEVGPAPCPRPAAKRSSSTRPPQR